MSYPTNQVSLVFSFMSTVAVSVSLILLALWIPGNKISLRWKLIINLLLAELINAANNSISGIFAFVSELKVGPGCEANGFIGQFSIQAADLSTLAIAVVTFMTLRSSDDPKRMEQLEFKSRLILTGIWVYPLITATVGYFWPGYVPTSSNWCWLAPNSLARYVLTHGLRVLIFVTIIILYSISAAQLLSAASTNGFSASGKDLENVQDLKIARKKIHNATIRLMAFPVVYLILWSPGMANRLLEALGQQSPLAGFLQSFTQLLGFADACLSIWNVRAIRK